MGIWVGLIGNMRKSDSKWIGTYTYILWRCGVFSSLIFFEFLIFFSFLNLFWLSLCALFCFCFVLIFFLKQQNKFALHWIFVYNTVWISCYFLVCSMLRIVCYWPPSGQINSACWWPMNRGIQIRSAPSFYHKIIHYNAHRELAPKQHRNFPHLAPDLAV